MREFTLEHGGETLTLCLNAGAIVVLEAMLDMPFGRAGLGLNGGSVTVVRGILYAASRKHHPKLKLDDIDTIIDADFSMAQAKATECFVSFVDVEGTQLEKLHKEHPFFLREKQSPKKTKRSASTSTASQTDG